MELLGLIDALEATILSSPKLLLTNKTIIDEPKVIGIIDKVRLVIKNGGHIIHDNVTKLSKDDIRVEPIFEKKQVLSSHEVVSNNNFKNKKLDEVDEIIERAKKEAQEIIENADNYAIDVLEKLHLTVMKVQRNVARVEKTIEDSKVNLKNDYKNDYIKNNLEKI
ncbi:MAG: hypothetical protein DKM50_11085 [Candidatus Margulisiibacteriota bacterium]|nr:MAG: hypothetical protein A2X43_12405 [Candidatus Margulisbacteria bacterium GWD2_39_127]OGI03255.1 MAG: hypothetical protein A2X42_11645 [Candidatus Margulisbacteria bacterium GWF2_38_17]OGI11278.1 MAG: hypothetical protein A2X41_04070 [Candidatus Margulisbacteria bacterium GWE2_39_32]PZM78501.1 MAG: hypothetical protein DKM50_11085 [Candidatus Margulisiibacteriota bacterium]HAR63935.1 hypothetical protein [Candidatus Margulisiibacteriota bacterium]